MPSDWIYYGNTFEWQRAGSVQVIIFSLTKVFIKLPNLVTAIVGISQPSLIASQIVSETLLMAFALLFFILNIYFI